MIVWESKRQIKTRWEQRLDILQRRRQDEINQISCPKNYDHFRVHLAKKQKSQGSVGFVYELDAEIEKTKQQQVLIEKDYEQFKQDCHMASVDFISSCLPWIEDISKGDTSILQSQADGITKFMKITKQIKQNTPSDSIVKGLQSRLDSDISFFGIWLR